jgi:hypothetical protein
MKNFGKGLPITAALFTLLYFGMLVHNWLSNAPNAKMINDLNEQIENELVNFRQMQKILEDIKVIH